MFLEGLWITESKGYSTVNRKAMKFTVMIMQPDFITTEMFEDARARLAKKKPGPGPARPRLETFTEGLCVQTLHVGPYATEPETVARLNTFVNESGYTGRDHHHEIYISDPFKTAPERMKTILRHPVTAGAVA